MRRLYRQYALEAHYEVSQWFKPGSYLWLLAAPWAVVCCIPVFAFYILFQASIALTFLPFFLISRLRRLFRRKEGLM